MADDLVGQLLGRARFLRDKGRIKSPDLMEEAAARIEALEAALAEARLEREVTEGRFMAQVAALQIALAEAEGRVKELEAVAVNEREDNLWNAYAVGHEADGLWTHLSMSDAEDLVRQCGLDVKVRYYDAAVIKAAIPNIARNVLPIRALASDALLDRQGKEGV